MDPLTARREVPTNRVASSLLFLHGCEYVRMKPVASTCSTAESVLGCQPGYALLCSTRAPTSEAAAAMLARTAGEGGPQECRCGKGETIHTPTLCDTLSCRHTHAHTCTHDHFHTHTQTTHNTCVRASQEQEPLPTVLERGHQARPCACDHLVGAGGRSGGLGLD